MSKKQLHSRLENLFLDLEVQEAPLPATVEVARPLSNWVWEADANGMYLSCGADAYTTLGYPEQKVVGQSIFKVGMHPQSAAKLKTILDQGILPNDLDVIFQTSDNNWVNARLHVFNRHDENGDDAGWRGFVQVLDTPAATLPEPVSSPRPRGTGSLRPILPPNTGGSRFSTPISGVAYQGGKVRPSTNLWTQAALQTLLKNELIASPPQKDRPAAIAVPIQLQSEVTGILEILDEHSDRIWTADEQLLVQEVASQLALALENAQLYAAVQQELGDRIHAEQETLQRNKDLASLNQIGQQLSKLTSPDEIFQLVAETIGNIINANNITIGMFDSAADLLKFPINIEDGASIPLETRPVERYFIDYILSIQEPLLINGVTPSNLEGRGITIPDRLPASVMGIPLRSADRTTGVIEIQDYENGNAYTQVQLDLLSTMAAQVATALENASLFQEIRHALQAIENRERYQANVAKAVAVLTEQGTKAMPQVLDALGQAAGCSHIYFAQIREDESGLHWRATALWVDPSLTVTVEQNKLQHMPVALFPTWAANLRDKGFFTGLASEATYTEKEFLSTRNVASTMLLAIPGSRSTPSFLAFEQISEERQWQPDEINVLRVATDAISNTIVREDLLDQLQVSLDESENLYNTSHRLALANDLQEMVAAITLGLHITAINRSLLVLFDLDTLNKPTAMRVVANWYNGYGTPPPPVGTEYAIDIYGRVFLASNPVFIEDLLGSSMDQNIKEIFLQQKIKSLALMPLWAGKRQIGVLLLEAEDRHHFSGREVRSLPPLVDQMGIGVENQRLFEQTQEALSETEQLYKMTDGISKAVDAQELVKLIAENILPEGADRITLYSFITNQDGSIGSVEVSGLFDKLSGTQTQGDNISIDSLPFINHIGSDPVMYNDLASTSDLDAVSVATFQRMNIHGLCVVPLRSLVRLLGFIAVSSRLPGEFTPDEIHLLQVVGNSITVSLEKQALLREAQRRALELQTAAELARDTSSTLSLDTLLKRFVNSLRERFNFYHVSLFLLDEKQTQAVVRESTGEAGEEMIKRNHKLAVGSVSIIGNATAKGEPVIINDVTLSKLYFSNPLLPNTRAEMGIPLKISNRVIGALDIQSEVKDAFKQADVTVLQILADQIAIAIENARAYELSQKAVEEIKEADRLKSQFLANMSHELRTPLNSIIGFSRVILKGIDGSINETQKQDLSSIYNSGQHLLRLITDILDLSKLEAGKMELQFADVNLPDMINSVMSTAVGLVKDKSIKLVQIVPENLPIVKADPTRVRQVLLNFLSNAAKFTEQGEITVEAAVREKKGMSEVLVTVKDTGPGIAEKDQAKLFLPFSQVDDSPTRKTGGTGLGLSISRQLIEMHGGKIGLMASEVGKGSTFFFTLPLRTPDAPVVPEQLSNGGNVILAIDDDPEIISLYERYLKPHGYQVVALTDPKRAVERAIQIQPIAITLDVMMPEIDGWHVIQDLKKEQQTRHIPVIMCSILEEEEKGFSMGAADYLVKPFLQEDLINAISRLNHDGKINDILIVGDSEADAQIVKKIVDETGKFSSRLVVGSKLGIEEIRNSCPDAILMDLFLPDTDGFSLLETLRTEKLYNNIPVIILTNSDLTPEQHKMLTDFSIQLLNKSLLREKDLLASIEGALRKFQSKGKLPQTTTRPLG